MQEQGLVRASHLALAEAGADIVGVGSTTLDETEKLVTEMGRRFYGITADLRNTENASRVIEETVEKMGHVDILCEQCRHHQAGGCSGIQ